MDDIEQDSWTIATFIMIGISVLAFITQRFIVQIFNYVFEFCIFYIPTVILVIRHLKQDRRKESV